MNSILTNPIQTDTFVSNPNEKWLYSFFGLVVLSVISILFYKSKIKNTIQQHKSILFDHKSQKLQFKGKTLDSFDSNELKIITYLIKNQADYIPLNSLNNLFEQDDLTENYSSTTKRREITLNAIITKQNKIISIRSLQGKNQEIIHETTYVCQT